VLQAVSDFNVLHGDDHFDAEWGVLEQMLGAAGGRPMSVSTMQRDHSPEQWKWILDRAAKANEKGFDVRCQVGARGIGVMLGLQATFHPFMGFPSYKAISQLPLAERVNAMGDPALKARIGEKPNYEPAPTDSFGAAAMSRGEPVLSLIYDAMLEQDGKALLYFPVYNYTGMNLDAVHEMLTHPLALPGLSDGGAHVGTICDASFTTFLMTHWARDRDHGRIPLERVIQMQAHDTARFLGLRDRGRLAPGLRADVNIIDFNKLQLLPPTMLKDLPAGGQRLMQHAKGYIATLVNGQVITKDGTLTGERPGRLVRAGAGGVS
jgi:N-acyl-D-aspartate/D-glutamate deacylase